MTTVNPDQAEFEELIDLPTLARWLGVKEPHIRRLVSERRIPFHKCRVGLGVVGARIRSPECSPGR